MAWYLDVGENCCYEEYKVEAWRWWKNGIIAFDKWAKEHNIHCEHRQDEDFGEGFDEIIFYDHYADTRNDENVIFKAMDEDLVLIYNPRIEETGLFPFTVENIEDFHKNYLWYEGYDEEWEWNEESFKNFSSFFSKVISPEALSIVKTYNESSAITDTPYLASLLL